MYRCSPRLYILALALSWAAACGDSKVSGPGSGGNGTGSGGNGTGSGGNGTGSGGGNGGGTGGGFTLPDASPGGGMGGGPGAAADAGGSNCAVLVATLRDFKVEHPDFEETVQTVKGLVKTDIGPDSKPVYAPAGATAVTSGREAFDQWYRDVPGVNMRFQEPIPLTPMPGGSFVYENNAFFPLDNKGFGNQGNPHNFHFTTEIHATFVYKGGERFTFKGDDDVFVFVNGKLALDLGGVHEVQTDTVNFDAQAATLGITRGNTYRLDVFHAERHTVQSNFRIETSIECLRPIVL